MGATLPVLSKFVSQDENYIGKDVGTLYSVNTFGAVVGAWSSAFIFMRLLGVQLTISAVALANIGIAVIIYFVFKPPLKNPIQLSTSSLNQVKSSLKKRDFLVLLSFAVA